MTSDPREQRAKGEWDYCQWCGMVGWRGYEFRALHDYGQCPNTRWRSVSEDVLENAREECDRLNENEAHRNPEDW